MAAMKLPIPIIRPIRRAADRYLRAPQAAKAGLWLAICGFLQKAVGFLTVPIFTRLLSAEQYGLVSVFNSWEALLSVLCTLNLFYGGFNNGMRDYAERRSEYVSSVQGMITAMTIGWAMLYFAGRPIFTKILGLSDSLTMTLFSQSLASAALSLWSAKARYEFRYRAVTVVTLAGVILSSVLPAAMILLFPDLDGALVRIYAHAGVLIALYGAVYIRNWAAGRRFFNREIWKSAFLFNLPLLPHYLSTMALNHADRIMIERMIGLREAGVYSVAYSAAMALTVLATAMNNAFAPWLYRALDGRQLKNVPKISRRLFALLAICLLLLIAFAPEWMALLAGQAYASAALVVPPVAASVYFIFMFQIFANVEFYYRQNRFIALASVIGAGLNLALNALCLPRFGYLAAGYTSLACYVLFGMAHFLCMRRICEKELPGIDLFGAKAVFLMGGLLTALSLLMLPLYPHPMIRCCLILAAALLLILLFPKIKRAHIGPKE